MNKMNRAGKVFGFVTAGLMVLTGAGCGERQPAASAAPPEPVVTFKPQEMADALHAVIAADQKTYAQPGGGTWLSSSVAAT